VKTNARRVSTPRTATTPTREEEGRRRFGDLPLLLLPSRNSPDHPPHTTDSNTITLTDRRLYSPFLHIDYYRLVISEQFEHILVILVIKYFKSIFKATLVDYELNLIIFQCIQAAAWIIACGSGRMSLTEAMVFVLFVLIRSL